MENIISILCKPNDVLYSKYDNEILLKDIENSSIVEVYNLINFYDFSKGIEKVCKIFDGGKGEGEKQILNRYKKYGLSYFLNYPKTMF